MCVRFDKKDGFIKIQDGIRYLVLSDCSWCDKICDSNKYLVSGKSGVAVSINHNFARSKIYSCKPLFMKTTAFHNVIILIKSVINKYKNHYHYNIFLKKVRIKINLIQYIFK